MRFYKETNFKDTEIGKIPKDWEVVRLGDILDLGNGQRPIFDADGDIPVYGANGIMGYSRDYLIESEYTLIIGRVGASGEIHLVSGRIWISDNAIYSRTYDCSKVNMPFLYYLLKKASLFRYAEKSTHPLITQSFLNAFKLPLPPLYEQEKIAEILSTVDELIQRTDEIIAKTERLKKGLMQELLTKGIGHKEFKETEIGRIPKDWEVVRLGDISADMYYGITAKAVNERTPLRMLRTTDIKDYKVEWNNLPFCQITERRKDIQKYFLQIGDLIVSRAGSAGMSVLVDKPLKDVIFGSYLIKIKLKGNVHPKYLQFFFRSQFYWDHILSGHAGSTLKNINLPVLKATPVILPPISEQEKIAEILSTVDERIEIERKRREKLERIKKSLMDLLLTGKIRVRID
jgi:type I restriction enzyme S subunit